jgi:hypothetical protein
VAVAVLETQVEYKILEHLEVQVEVVVILVVVVQVILLPHLHHKVIMVVQAIPQINKKVEAVAVVQVQ